MPIRTDVQVSYFPWGTIAMIFLNWVAFGWELGADVEDIERFMLAYGDGIHPVQWLTSIFLHDGIFHFLGNMIFLWVFGLVVEGKLGPSKFIPLYLGIGVAQCAIEQLLFLGADGGGSLGASSAIFGLIGISMIWAPKIVVDVFYLVLVRGGTVRLTVQTLASIYLSLSFIDAGFNYFLFGESSSAFLHLMGVAVGIPIGIWLLRKEVVDCQDWDWFSVRAGKHLEGMRLVKDDPAEVSEEVAMERIDEELSLAEELVDGSIEEGNFGEAARLYADAADSMGGWKLIEPKLRQITEGVIAAEGVAGALDLITEYRERFPDECPAIDLAWGEHLLETAKQHSKAKDVLEEIDPAGLTPAEAVRRDALLQTAKQKIDDGEFEFFD